MINCHFCKYIILGTTARCAYYGRNKFLPWGKACQIFRECSTSVFLGLVQIIHARWYQCCAEKSLNIKVRMTGWTMLTWWFCPSSRIAPKCHLWIRRAEQNRLRRYGLWAFSWYSLYAYRKSVAKKHKIHTNTAHTSEETWNSRVTKTIIHDHFTFTMLSECNIVWFHFLQFIQFPNTLPLHYNRLHGVTTTNGKACFNSLTWIEPLANPTAR